MAVIVDKDRKCREIERLIASGRGVCESCRELRVSEKTFHRWRHSIRNAPEALYASRRAARVAR